MVSTPRVSVIMPKWNRSGLLREAIASIVGQTFENWELIVIDDGSTDDTAVVLRAMRDDRIRVERTAHTANPATARNVGLGLARGDWVAFLGDDDVWRPTKLATQLERAKHSGCRWSYSAAEHADQAGRAYWRTPPDRLPSGNILLPLLALDAAVAGTTVVVARELLESVGGFDARFPRAHDFVLWTALAERAEVVAVEEPLTLIGDHGDREHRSQVHAVYVEHLRRRLRVARGAQREACRRGLAALWIGRLRWLINHGRSREAAGDFVRGLGDVPLRLSAWAVRGVMRRIAGRS